MISKTDYQKNKEYWDYQRLVEYNREKAWEELQTLAELNDVDAEVWWEQFWNQVEEEDYDTPPYGWEPKDLKYRIDK